MTSEPPSDPTPGWQPLSDPTPPSEPGWQPAGSPPPLPPGAAPPGGFTTPGYPPAPASGQSPEWLKPLLLTLGVVLVVLMCCVGSAAVVGFSMLRAGPSVSSGAPAGPDPYATVRPAPARSGPVRDGAFEFTVRTVECGASRVGTGNLTVDARGRFCVATVAVRNLGEKPQRFTAAFQRAVTATGAEVMADVRASIYANAGNPDVGNPLAPGGAVVADLVYDVPTGTDLDRLVLYESLVSPGVPVKVG